MRGQNKIRPLPRYEIAVPIDPDDIDDDDHDEVSRPPQPPRNDEEENVVITDLDYDPDFDPDNVVIRAPPSPSPEPGDMGDLKIVDDSVLQKSASSNFLS